MMYGGYHDEPEVPDDLFECALHLRNNLFGITTEGGSEPEYKLARARLMEDPQVKSMLPNFVRYSTDTKAVQLSLMSVASGSGSWALRRSHVSDTFQPLLTYLESGGAASDASIAVGLEEYDAPHVQATWQKAIDRRTSDPEGAVTAACTLLEEVCKHVIEDCGEKWERKWDLPKLYREAASHLKLAPSDHHEELFKSILGSCQNIVQGIGSFRNSGGSDAHAGGRKRVKPLPRHAAFAVNLAGTSALFLIETLKARQDGG